MVFTSTLRIEEDKWNHVSVTINKRNNTVTFTKDHFQEELIDSDINSLSNNNSNIFIGYSVQYGSYFKGDIDNVSIYTSNVDYLNLEKKEGTFSVLNLKNINTDVSGFGSSSSYVNSNIENTTNQNGVVDSAFIFDATTHSKIIVHNSEYNGYKNKNVTFSAWVNPDIVDFSSVLSNMPILCKDLVSSKFEFGINTSGNIYASLL
jgi:protein gp37